MLNGAARDFGSDEGFHEVQHAGVAEKSEHRLLPHVHDVDVIVDRGVFPGDQGQPPLEGFVLVQFGDPSFAVEFAGPFVDKVLDPCNNGIQVVTGERAFDDDVAFIHEMP